jgi:hypothetical protein
MTSHLFSEHCSSRPRVRDANAHGVSRSDERRKHCTALEPLPKIMSDRCPQDGGRFRSLRATQGRRICVHGTCRHLTSTRIIRSELLAIAITGSLGGFRKGVSSASGDAEPSNLRSRDPLPAALTGVACKRAFMGTAMVWGPQRSMRIAPHGISHGNGLSSR